MKSRMRPEQFSCLVDHRASSDSQFDPTPALDGVSRATDCTNSLSHASTRRCLRSPRFSVVILERSESDWSGRFESNEVLLAFVQALSARYRSSRFALRLPKTRVTSESRLRGQPLFAHRRRLARRTRLVGSRRTKQSIGPLSRGFDPARADELAFTTRLRRLTARPSQATACSRLLMRPSLRRRQSKIAIFVR